MSVGGKHLLFFFLPFPFSLQVDDVRVTEDPAMGSAVTSIALCNLSLSGAHRGIF